MRTLLIVLVILAVAGGTIFYLGWVQILLPPETYAVIFTRLNGYERDVIRPGAFCWRWERLIPGNMTLYRFRLAPFATETKVQGSLPSADAYSSVAPEKPDFSYEASFRVSLRVRPEALPDLVARQKLTPDAFADYCQARSQSLGRQLADLLISRQGQAPLPEVLPAGRLERDLAEQLQLRDPSLEILDLTLLDLKVPDLQLYRQAQELYDGILQARGQAQREAIARQVPEQEKRLAELRQEQEKIKVWEQYGELLNRYPVLLKLLYVQNLGGRSADVTGAAGLTTLEVPPMKLPPVLQDSD
jgi:hypothetical protein